MINLIILNKRKLIMSATGSFTLGFIAFFIGSLSLLEAASFQCNYNNGVFDETNTFFSIQDECGFTPGFTPDLGKFCDKKTNKTTTPVTCPIGENDFQAVINAPDTSNPINPGNNGTNNNGGNNSGSGSTSTTQRLDSSIRVLGGSSCIKNRADCADKPGTVNLVDSLEDGIIKVSDNTSVANAISTLSQAKTNGGYPYGYGEDYTNVCISKDVKALGVFFRATASGDTKELISVDAAVFLGSAQGGLRACPGNWILSKAPSSANYSISGCCPDSTYQAVTPATLDAGVATPVRYQDAILCCKIPTGASKGGESYPDRTNETGTVCQNKQGKDLSIIMPSYTSEYPPIADRGMINADGGKLRSDVGTLSISKSIKNAFSCPREFTNGCAATVAQPNSESDIINSADVNASCTKCFANGSPISADLEAKTLLMCEAGVAKPYPFINGTINDTLAYLAAQEASGPENAEQLKGCRESGGIYLGIGCVDPTPLGILTGMIRIAFGIMGGVALAQLIYAGIMYQSGDEAKIAEARSKVLATIGGVAVLVFSVLILRIIGVNVLDIIPEGAI